MNARKDYDQMLDKIARDSALDWMDGVIKTQEQGVADLKRRRAQFEEAHGPNPHPSATPINVLSWFVNDIHNIARNVRLDTAINHSAALSAAAQRRED